MPRGAVAGRLGHHEEVGDRRADDLDDIDHLWHVATEAMPMPWIVDVDAGRPFVRGGAPGVHRMNVSVHPPGPAIEGDELAAVVAFIGHAAGDVRMLVEEARRRRTAGEVVRALELAPIEARLAAAAAVVPIPWVAWLESEGGLGGDSVIQPTSYDHDIDVYVTFVVDGVPVVGSDVAADAVIRFLGAAPAAISDLLAELRRDANE